MPRTARILLLALATTLVASRGVRAQCTGGHQTKITTFTVTPTALSFGTATVAQFNAGFVQSQYTITVDPQTGQQWFLCVQATSANMGTVNGHTKPIGELQWSLNGTTWTSFATGTLQAITNNRGTQTLTVFVRTLLSYGNDIPQANLSPGTYSANLAFQVSM